MNNRRARLVGLEQLGARQENLVTTEQLDGLGFSRKEVLGLVKRRYLHRIHRGVYAIGTRQLTRRGWLLAASLACGETSFLTHRTGAAVRGLRTVNPWEIHVTVIGTAIRRRRGIVIHRITEPPHRSEVTTVDGLRVASVPLILIQLAPHESRAELDRMIEQAVRRDLLVMNEMEEALARHPGARGVCKLRAALEAYSPKPFDKSDFERVVGEAIAADPRIPPPLRHQHFMTGDIRWELDFYWPDRRVVLEVDGDRYHRTPKDRERDRIKDAKLMAAGLVPMRMTDTRWKLDQKGSLDDLRAILDLTRSPPPPS
jgi:very-short-patch-repair endonuclease